MRFQNTIYLGTQEHIIGHWWSAGNEMTNGFYLESSRELFIQIIWQSYIQDPVTATKSQNLCIVVHLRVNVTEIIGHCLFNNLFRLTRLTTKEL